MVRKSESSPKGRHCERDSDVGVTFDALETLCVPVSSLLLGGFQMRSPIAEVGTFAKNKSQAHLISTL